MEHHGQKLHNLATARADKLVAAGGASSSLGIVFGGTTGSALKVATEEFTAPDVVIKTVSDS